MAGELDGQVAIVTGSVRRIGRAIALKLAAGGAAIVVNAKSSADEAEAVRREIEELGGRALVRLADVADERAVQGMVEDALAAFGRIDILVNNAGFSGPTLPVAELPEDQWRRILDVNLTGAYLVSKAVAAVMVPQGWGRIVNIASLAGKEGTPHSAAYSASKAGLIALTKAHGKELARTGVLVNAVAPAAIKTALLDQMQPEHVQTMIAKSPMQRLGTVDEVAALTLWLCSASCTFNTGAVFDLSGGRATY
jgi:NAD(P)-dependent dehydrogenase (short-subunit alcohol dehydrogenase family)